MTVYAWIVIGWLGFSLFLIAFFTFTAWLENRAEQRPFQHDDWAREWEDRYSAPARQPWGAP